MSLPATLQGIVRAANYENVFHYLLVSTISVLSTEYVLTLHDEIRFIWNSRFSLAKILYLLNRYIPPINVMYAIYLFIFTKKTGAEVRDFLFQFTPTFYPISIQLCRKEFIVMGSVVYFQFAIASAVLCVRAYAVWKPVKPVLVLLVTLFIASVSTEGYVVGLYFAGATAFNLGAGVPGCLILLTNNKMWITLVVLVCSDAVALALLLIKSFTAFRSSKSGLLTVMVRDGIGYFACVMGLFA